MTGYSSAQIWMIIAAMGIGTFAIRFSFLGLLGNRQLPDWLLRHLRYTAVAILPAMIAPLVLWPNATGGEPDAPRLAAAAIALAVGIWAKNAIAAIFGGMITLYLLQYLLG